MKLLEKRKSPVPENARVKKFFEGVNALPTLHFLRLRVSLSIHGKLLTHDSSQEACLSVILAEGLYNVI